MECFIKKIFEDNIDEEVHEQFIKFSRGVYKNKFLAEGEKKAGKWKIKTGPEYANYFVKKCLENFQGNLEVKGIIISTYDLCKDMNFEFDLKKYMGINKYVINTTINSEDLKDLMEKNPRIFYGLSFSVPDCQLRIKAKPPKSAKPSASTETVKADFCSLTTTKGEIIKDLFFFFPNFQKISVSHDVIIEDIVYPENAQSLKPEELRERSKRKGKIIRKISIDGKEEVKEKEFVA